MSEPVHIRVVITEVLVEILREQKGARPIDDLPEVRPDR